MSTKFINTKLHLEPGAGEASGAGNNGTGNPAQIKLPAAGAVGKSAFDSLLAQMAPGGGTENNQAEPLQTSLSGERVTDDGQGAGGELGEDGQPLENADNQNGDGQGAGGVELDEATQGHLEELAKLITSGEVSIGEVKRLKKVLAQKSEADSAVATLSAKVEELTRKLEGNTQTAQAVKSDNPFAGLVKDTKTLEDARREMKNIKRWCEMNPDGGTRNGKEFSAEETKALRWEAEDALEEHLPARERELNNQVQTAAQLRQSQQGVQTFMKTNHPKYYDTNTDLGMEVARLRGTPEIANRPDADVLAVALAVGLTTLKREEDERQAKAKGGATGAAGRPATTVKTGGAPRPANGAAGKVGGSGIRRAFDAAKKDGSKASFDAALDAIGLPGGGRR